MSDHCCGNEISPYDPEDLFSEEAVYIMECFRLLWQQHVYWTRMVIMGIVFALPDLEASTARLLRNPLDFARVFRRFYGNKAATEFCDLLKDHLVIAGELVKAAKAGNQRAAAAFEKKWYANADDIVCFLNRLNPCWTVEHMREMWYEHLALTKEEAVAMLNKKYANGVRIFNQIEKQALMMADDFADGIIRQFSL